MSLVEQAIGKLRAAEGSSAGVPAKERRQQNGAPGSVPPPALETRPVHQLDPEVLRSAGLFPPKTREKQLKFEFRQIKRRLLDAAFGRGTSAVENGRVIAVTSSLPGEGKSFVSTNLALSIAREQHMRVLLIDADCQKRNISEAMGFADEPGLIDAVRGDNGRNIQSCIIPTSFEGLMVMPSGTRAESYTEILASQVLAAQIRSLVESDPGLVVIIDTSPVLVTTEATAVEPPPGRSCL